MKSWKKDSNLSSLKKEFSKETKIVKKTKKKKIIRSKVHVGKAKYVWKKQSICGRANGQAQNELHEIQMA